MDRDYKTERDDAELRWQQDIKRLRTWMVEMTIDHNCSQQKILDALAQPLTKADWT